jgi:hypothetical protein
LSNLRLVIYLIDKSKNRINKIEQTTFKKEGFQERKHLQEWIANNPDCLQEPLSIIQKEFNSSPRKLNKCQ